MEKNLTTTTPEEEEEVELVVDPKQLEKNKEVRSTVPRYRWANVYDTCDGNMTLLTNDVSEFSIYEAGEKVLKSHVFSALGAALHEGCDIIVWIDWPLSLVQASCEKRTANRVYWGSSIKSRKYDYLYLEGDCFGLSPAMQSFRFKDDQHLRTLGLKLQEARFSFTTDLWDEKVRYLQLDLAEANERWTKARLKKWLGIVEAGEDERAKEHRQETIETDLAMRKRGERMDEV